MVNLEVLEKVAADYKREFNTDYIEDLYKVHEGLGLARENKGEKILFYLTRLSNNYQTISRYYTIVHTSKNAFFQIQCTFIARAFSSYKNTT